MVTSENIVLTVLHFCDPLVGSLLSGHGSCCGWGFVLMDF